MNTIVDAVSCIHEVNMIDYVSSLILNLFYMNNFEESILMSNSLEIKAKAKSRIDAINTM